MMRSYTHLSRLKINIEHRRKFLGWSLYENHTPTCFRLETAKRVLSTFNATTIQRVVIRASSIYVSPSTVKPVDMSI